MQFEDNQNIDLNFSYQFTEKYKDDKNNLYLNILSKKTNIIERDEDVKKCNSCSSVFGMYGKHHCRYCGKIFCSNCSSKKIILPNKHDNIFESKPKIKNESSFLNTFKSYIVYTNDEKRVCDICFELINTLNLNVKNIQIFFLLNFTLKDVKKHGILKKEWLYPSHYYLGKFKNIQYKLCSDKYSKLEKKLLSLNAKYLSGHSIYMYNLLKMCKTDSQIGDYIKYITFTKKYTCKSLMCGPCCNDMFSDAQILSLLNHYSHIYEKKKIVLIQLLQLIIDHFSNFNSEPLFECYIPFIIFHLKNDYNMLIKNYLLNKCKESNILFNSIFWQVRLLMQENPKYIEFYNELIQLQPLFKSQEKLINRISNIYSSNTLSIFKTTDDDIQIGLNFETTMYSPLNPHIEIKNIDFNKISIGSSATRPMIIPCKSNVNYVIMYKEENVVKDQIVMHIIKLFRQILLTEKLYDPQIVTYNVLPINKNSGFIEFVNDCETIDNINTKHQNILNYVFKNDKNRNEVVANTYDIIINSLASYCVITFLLSVGDRHLDNIMVTKDGKIFHVDYGYILGEEPTADYIKSAFLGSSNIKITEDMIGILQNLDSNSNNTFINKCCEIYSCLRKYHDIVLLQLLLLPKMMNIGIDNNYIIALVNSKFMPNKSDNDAIELFKQEINKSIEEAAKIGIKTKDVVHSFGKNSNGISSTIGTGISSLFSRFW